MATPTDKFGSEGPNALLLGNGADVEDLQVYNTQHGTISAWRLDEDELKRLNETGVIFLKVFGSNHPAVCVTTDFEGLKTLGVNS